MKYESWRISFQSSEAAAKAAYSQVEELSEKNAKLQKALEIDKQRIDAYKSAWDAKDLHRQLSKIDAHFNAEVYELPRIEILTEIERITKGLIENNEDIVDVLWVNNGETALEALSNLYEFVGGKEDLQLKLWPENEILTESSVISGANLTTSGSIGQP